jgi:hypothetical protein
MSVMRVAALLQATFIVVTALVVLSRSGLWLKGWFRASKWAVWLIVVFGAFLGCVEFDYGKAASGTMRYLI